MRVRVRVRVRVRLRVRARVRVHLVRARDLLKLVCGLLLVLGILIGVPLIG